MKQHRRSLSLVALMGIASVASVLVWLNQSRADRIDLFQSYLNTLNEIVLQANHNYYKEANAEKMLEGAIRGAVAALQDPYSFYQSPQQQQREQEDLFHAEFGGLGIRIYPELQGEQAVVKVSSPLPNSPAIRAGLQPGDAIIKVNDESVILGGPTGLTMNDVVTMLRGPVGEPVTITIVRRNRLEPFDVTLYREVIQLESVRWQTIEPGVGYVLVESFTSHTMDEFERAVKEMQANGELRALIIDLRDNRGGLLTSAKAMADAFLDRGTIVYTQGKRQEFNHTYKADRHLLVDKTVDVVVLVNGNSASGSEIVAGALRDHKRGILVGTTTFGKGVVQQRFALSNGGAVSLTISAYYTPNGVSIDGEGIKPNVEITPDVLSEEEAWARERIRERKIVDDFVLGFINDYEAKHGKTPKDFALLEARLPELVERIEEENVNLKERTIWFEARSIFDRNVGVERLSDVETDTQLAEALRIIKEGGVAKVLDGSYVPPSATALN